MQSFCTAASDPRPRSCISPMCETSKPPTAVRTAYARPSARSSPPAYPSRQNPPFWPSQRGERHLAQSCEALQSLSYLFPFKKTSSATFNDSTRKAGIHGRAVIARSAGKKRTAQASPVLSKQDCDAEGPSARRRIRASACPKGGKYLLHSRLRLHHRP